MPLGQSDRPSPAIWPVISTDRSTIRTRAGRGQIHRRGTEEEAREHQDRAPRRAPPARSSRSKSSEEIHAVLHRRSDRGCVLGRVSQDRHDEDADEDIAEAEFVRRRLDRPHQDLAHQAIATVAPAAAPGRPSLRSCRWLPFLGRVGAREERGVGDQREHGVQEISEKEHHRDRDAQPTEPLRGRPAAT